MIEIDETHRPSVPVKNGDDDLLELYITHAGLNSMRAKDARDMFHLFKTVVNKPLAKCTRDDGRAVVAALGNKVKSSTLRRKMVPLVAMANFGIAEGRITLNPFAATVALTDDSERRLPFTDEDIAVIRANLSKLNTHDQLLVRLLATTGMRLGEAFQIDSEQTERGVRFVIVGSKTEQSLRRVPFPAALIEHLPKPIKGPLFSGKTNTTGKRIAAWLRDDCKIVDPAKVAAHSYRHRMQDRFRAIGCPPDLREEILGRDKRTVAQGYGVGSPVTLLKEWLDKADGF